MIYLQKIPVTIITGFLGSGKTTVINQLLQQPHQERIAVIVNEYGEIGVDHQLVINSEEEIFQMNNGCLCCTLRSDLSNVLHSILEVSKEQETVFDRIIIETTGLAEPGPIVQTFFRLPYLQEYFVIDSVMTLVDAVNGLHQIAHYEESVDQIAFADKIWLTKLDEADSRAEYFLRQKLVSLNPHAEIERLDKTDLPFDHFFGQQLFEAANLSHLDEAKEDSCEINQTDTHFHDHEESGEHHHSHTHAITSISLRTDRPLHPVRLDEWISELVMTFNMDLLRYKGILQLYDEPNKIVYQGVNMAMQFYRTEPWENENRESVLVLIGKDLPEKEIKRSFKACIMDEELIK
ncbi:cobalamin biosynthesis protein CobW [Marinilactibacillus psychrotolerans]|uniref:Cobalamin biosynthesis protein CobW n=1 Tax=Marinilactibacillus psychrotolerans TaxID=191770 RepID=A0AAV3WRT4_9LACT|nr:cobalamin biosynthesis protein CobW [Marinilactibacillus psychrotolerans]GEQ34753.1 cobalamin biosynthesis protein CobW [Marinilactibacillus psychrotolerans]